MQSLILPDGRPLAWREQGSGPPLVLLHGWSMSSAVFTEALTELAANFRVLAPDLRGHGASAPKEGYAFADFADDVQAWLGALGLDRIHLLGWSLGGQVALELCCRSLAVERLILVGTTPRFCAGHDWPHGLPPGQVRTMNRNLQRQYLKTQGDFFDLMLAGETLSPQRRRQIVDFAVRGGRLPEPEVALAALETLHDGDQRQRLAAIACPTLVMHGALDAITLPEAGRALAAGIPNARFVLFPGLAHAPFLSRPAEVFRQWREFLA